MTILALASCQREIEYVDADWVDMVFPADGVTVLISAATDQVEFKWKAREGATYRLMFDDDIEFGAPVEYDCGSDSVFVTTAGQLHKDLLTIDPEFHGSKRFFWRIDQELNGIQKHCWRYFTAIYAAGSFVDDRDGVTYNTITYEIDDLTSYEIMTDNLRATVYADGKPLTDGAKTCNDGIYADDQFFVASVGCYYTWRDAVRMDVYEAEQYYLEGVQVQGICPKGWHLPSYDEWDNLISYFGGETDGALKTCVPKYWAGYPTATNELKFNIYPSGLFWGSGEEEMTANVGVSAFFWSSTPAVEGTSYSWGTFQEKTDYTKAAALCIWSETSGGIYKYYQDSGFAGAAQIMTPVRCIRDYEKGE